MARIIAPVQPGHDSWNETTMRARYDALKEAQAGPTCPHCNNPACPENRQRDEPFTVSALYFPEAVIDFDFTEGNSTPPPLPSEADIVDLMMSLQWAAPEVTER